MKKYVIGVFSDEEILTDALKSVHSAGLKIHDVYSPFPLHNVDDLLGIKRSKLTYVCFGGGLIGLLIAIFFQIYTQAFSWPLIIGGKPFNSLPAFIPIGFELTILFAALITTGAFLYKSNLFPGKDELFLDIPATDDKFVIAVEVQDNESNIKDLLLKFNAEKINSKEV